MHRCTRGHAGEPHVHPFGINFKFQGCLSNHWLWRWPKVTPWCYREQQKSTICEQNIKPNVLFLTTFKLWVEMKISNESRMEVRELSWQNKWSLIPSPSLDCTSVAIILDICWLVSWRDNIIWGVYVMECFLCAASPFPIPRRKVSVSTQHTR